MANELRNEYCGTETLATRINACKVRAARGSYQRDLLDGRTRVSGADLRGAARSYAARYAGSRAAVMRRFGRAITWEFGGGLEAVICVGDRGRKYLAVVDTASRKEVWAA